MPDVKAQDAARKGAPSQDSKTDLPDQFSAVAATALIVANCRARESRRPDAWFVDPLAVHLAAGYADWDTRPLPPVLVAWLAVRTRFLDEMILQAFASGVRQLVIVGAGLDARAFRLPLPPQSMVFEVDRADLLDSKEQAVISAGLNALCGRRLVVADVALDDWFQLLRDQDWQPNDGTVWIVEGFLIYFEQPVREAILRAIAGAGSPLDILGATLAARQVSDDQPLWKQLTDENPVSWFARCGWRAETTMMAAASADYGRPLSRAGRGSAGLISATRNAASAR